MSHFEWGERIRLEAIPNTKKIELMDFYNKKLKEVKFTRNSVVMIKSNGSRADKMNISLLKRRN